MATEGGGVYMPLDAGFCDTAAARQVRRRLGDAGFYAYVKMHCCLLNEPGGRLPLALADEWEDLAERLCLDVEQTKELVAVMRRYKALELDEDGAVWSPVVVRSMLARDEIKDARRRGAYASAEARRRKKAQGQSAEQSAV